MDALPLSPPPPVRTHPLTGPAAGARWRVRLLGGFEIDDGRHRHTRLRSRAAMALLARVALAPARDHAREELATLLWPEADATTCRNRLRQTLSLLKAVLEPPGTAPVLLADRRVVRAAPGALWCDATAFEQALRMGDPAEAAALYRGELLPGFYDEWIHDERGRLQALQDGLAGAAPVAEAAAMAAPAANAAANAGGVPATSPPAAPSVAPPVARSGSQGPALRLPHYLTRLVGADQAGARLLALASEQRLVTLLGPGGCGKTRLAVEVAHHALAGAGRTPAFDSAVFVSLVDVSDATGLLDRLQQALNLPAGDDLADALQQALAGRRMLLVLDNAEQLDDAAVGTVATLAERLPGLHWLVTSRRALGLDGEHTMPLDTLPWPDADAPLDEVAMNPAVALFVDRARAHRPDFHVSAANRDALAALARRLDGLPLALELAASQARSLGPAQLLALLDDAQGGALDLLARRGPRSGSDRRHASMRSVVAWSWQLLPAPLQAMLAALAPLPAGACRPLAAALAGGLPAALAQAQLDDLVAQSVLRVHLGADGEARYTAYEPVRDHVRGLDDPAAAQARRRQLLAALLAWAAAMPATPPLPAVRDELPNVTLALQHAAADGQADDAARLVLLLQSSWGEMALPGGVLQVLDTLADDPALAPDLAAGVHALAAAHRQQAGAPDTVRRHMQRAIQRLADCSAPDPAVHTMVLSRVARLHWRMDRDAATARAMIDQALPLARQHNRPNTEASLISLQAHLASVADGDPVRGAELAAQSLALWQRSGNRHLINAGRFNVATNRMQAGHAAETLPEWDALEAEGRALQDWDLASGALEGKGTALQALRRWEESAAALRDSVRVAWQGLETMALAYALWNLPPALLRLGQATLAAETMGAAEALFRARFGPFDDSDARDLRRIRRGSRALLGAAAAQAAWQRGGSRPLADSVRAVLG